MSSLDNCKLASVHQEQWTENTATADRSKILGNRLQVWERLAGKDQCPQRMSRTHHFMSFACLVEVGLTPSFEALSYKQGISAKKMNKTE